MELDGFEAIAGLADDFDAGHDVEQSDETLADDVMVVDNENADMFTHYFFVPFSVRMGASSVMIVPLSGELSTVSCALIWAARSRMP